MIDLLPLTKSGESAYDLFLAFRREGRTISAAGPAVHWIELDPLPGADSDLAPAVVLSVYRLLVSLQTRDFLGDPPSAAAFAWLGSGGAGRSRLT